MPNWASFIHFAPVSDSQNKYGFVSDYRINYSVFA